MERSDWKKIKELCEDFCMPELVNTKITKYQTYNEAHRVLMTEYDKKYYKEGKYNKHGKK